jgi:hypothetical protein
MEPSLIGCLTGIAAEVFGAAAGGFEAGVICSTGADFSLFVEHPQGRSCMMSSADKSQRKLWFRAKKILFIRFPSPKMTAYV